MASSNNMQLITFFSDATANGDSSSYQVAFNKGVLRAYGTWNGASVSMYSITSDGTSIELSDWSGNPISLTETTETLIENILWNETLYAVISNSGDSTSLTVTLQRL